MNHPVTVLPDIAYGPEPMQRLDLYRPELDGPVPVVAYLHGGGWQVGDKTADAKERLERLASYGVAVASLNYRLVPDAVFPAQIQDAQRGVAWLRAHGQEYGLATERIGVWGASAGGYLASMTGLTTGHPAFTPFTTGEEPVDQPSVQAVVDWFGQSDLASNSRRSWLEQEILSPPFEHAFLAEDDPARYGEKARLASPLTHVSAAAPPFLIVHGDRDRITPFAESAALHDALVRAGASSTLITLGGAGHESHEFDATAHLAMTAAFLLDHLSDRG